MVAVIVFGIVLLVVAEEVVRLARDARVDTDADGVPERDVFTRRRDSARALLRRCAAALRAGRQSISAATAEVAAVRVQRRMEAPTVRLPKPSRA